MWGTRGVRVEQRPAFYALAPGGWRDYVTLLHPPYTAWHLSLCRDRRRARAALPVVRLLRGLAAFFLALGVGAHALDELNGRPLRTRDPRAACSSSLAAASIGGALRDRSSARSPSDSVARSPFVVVGRFIVFAYNLELFGGRFHSDVWFALAWGAFPVLTAYFGAAEPSARRPCSPRRSRRSSAWRSGSSRRRCARSGAAPIASPARSRSATAARSRSRGRASSRPRGGPPSARLGDRRTCARTAHAASRLAAGRTPDARASCGHESVREPFAPGNRAPASRAGDPERDDQVRGEAQLRAEADRWVEQRPSRRLAFASLFRRTLPA